MNINPSTESQAMKRPRSFFRRIAEVLVAGDANTAGETLYRRLVWLVVAINISYISGLAIHVVRTGRLWG